MSICDPLRSLGANCVDGFMAVISLVLFSMLAFVITKKNPASFQLRGFADPDPDILDDQCYPAECRNNLQAW